MPVAQKKQKEISIMMGISVFPKVNSSISELPKFTPVDEPSDSEMAVMRKRFSSVCSSSSTEEDSASLYDSILISATDPPSEQEHPYASLLW